MQAVFLGGARLDSGNGDGALLLQQIANGLVIGSTYAVVAIGFALAFTVLRVINFAHPDIFMVGMFAGLIAGGAGGRAGLVVALGTGALGSVGWSAIALERTVHRAVARARRADDADRHARRRDHAAERHGADRRARSRRLPDAVCRAVRRYRSGGI